MDYHRALSEISGRIIEQMGRGVTCLEGKGMYSGSSKKVLLCVVGKRQILSAVQIVRGYDPSAFVIIQTQERLWERDLGKWIFDGQSNFGQNRQ